MAGMYRPGDRGSGTERLLESLLRQDNHLPVRRARFEHQVERDPQGFEEVRHAQRPSSLLEALSKRVRHTQGQCPVTCELACGGNLRECLLVRNWEGAHNATALYRGRHLTLAGHGENQQAGMRMGPADIYASVSLDKAPSLPHEQKRFR